ncbi:hypothetical protein COT48_01305 [Candidatus Woesearchaeota archaeon CG08_land_8_20_14_0_20_47_9]|nr:MAG: hypothetical protein COT48_01305 [Candidatus Woesearchaeota archaeon CG08_land_8_20_14_0_20_47_9]
MNLGLESLTTKKRNLIGNVLFSKIGASELQVLHKYSYSMADMHFHPNALFLRGAARDRRYKEIIDSARKMGAGLAVTEHNTISSYLSLSKNKKGVTVIPAMEISCNNRPHFLFYFYSNGELAEFYERHVKP